MALSKAWGFGRSSIADRHGDIEGLEFNAQSFVVDAAQVFVAGQQDGAAEQGRFRRDDGIIGQRQSASRGGGAARVRGR